MPYAAFLEISAADPLNLSPLIYGLIALAALIGALVGFWRGAARQAVKFGAVLVSIIFAYALSVIIFNRVWDYLSVKSVAEIEALFSKIGISLDKLHVSYFYELSPETSSLLFAVVPALVALPILFVPLFLIANSVMHAFYRLISYLCGFRSDRNTHTTRGWGALIGIAEALVFTGVLFTPIVGFSQIASEAVAVIEEHAPDESFTHNIRDKYTAYAESVSKNKAIRIYDKLGIGALYERIATVELDGEMKNTTELVADVATLISDTIAFKGTHPRHLTSEDEERIKGMIAVFEKNPYLAEILAGTVKDAARAYEAGAFPIKVHEPYDALIKSALDIFKSSDVTNIVSDLDTLSDAYFILAESGALSAFDDGADAMLSAMAKTDENGFTAASRVTDVLRANERTAPLVTLITKLSVTVMSDGAGIDPASDNTYEKIKSKINSELVSIDKSDFATEAEYTDSVAEQLDVILIDSGIELDKKYVFGMAEFYAEHFSDTDEITDDMANDFIFSYFDAYVKYISE